jgi:hypothetical protein
MNIILRYILFRTVLVVIILHSIIAHPHSDQLSEEKHFELHQETNSLIGIIRLTLHESDDDNLDNLVFARYESFKILNTNCNYSEISISNNTLFILEKWEAKTTANNLINDFKSLLFVKSNGLRGPPQLA